MRVRLNEIMFLAGAIPAKHRRNLKENQNDK